MAGAGAKKFPAFSKLSSDDVNNYLADQVIMRFATTTARDAAFGGVGEPTLAEGMTAYIDNLNVLQTYDGSNWVTTTALQSTRDVSSGLVYIASGTQSGSAQLIQDGVFTSAYTNYRLIMNGVQTSVADRAVRLNLRTAGVTNINNVYEYAYRGLRTNGTGGDTAFNFSTFAEIGIYMATYANTLLGSATVDIMAPQVAQTTFGLASGIGYEGGVYQMRNGGFTYNDVTVFDGFRIGLSSTGNIAFDWQLYGYRK
jgi:hypothetical protein